MAMALNDFGDPIGDHTLVLMLLHGLSAKFCPMVSNLKMRQPFPTFEEARTLLLLEEINIDDITTETDAAPLTPPALVAAPNVAPCPPSGGGSGSSRQGG